MKAAKPYVKQKAGSKRAKSRIYACKDALLKGCRCYWREREAGDSWILGPLLGWERYHVPFENGKERACGGDFI